jgi:hypothetical protein
MDNDGTQLLAILREADVAYWSDAFRILENLRNTMPESAPRVRPTNRILRRLEVLNRLEQAYLPSGNQWTPGRERINHEIFDNLRTRIKMGEPLRRYVSRPGTRGRRSLKTPGSLLS